MAERVAGWQDSPDEGWALVRRHFRGQAAVRVVDADREVDYFLLVMPRADLGDYALDGMVFKPDELEGALDGHSSIQLPRQYQEKIRPTWAGNR
jgi:hypothetical protein